MCMPTLKICIESEVQDFIFPIHHHIYAIGMSHVRQEEGGKGRCTATSAKCSQHFLLQFHF